VSCEVCQRVFQDKIALENHEEKNHESDDEKTFDCDQCNRTFAAFCGLLLHKKFHNFHTVDRFWCDLCNKSSANKNSLRSHMRELHRSKKIMCKFCDQGFRYEPHYRTHLLRHIRLADKCPWRCDLCPKAYTKKKALKQHIEMTHLGKVVKFSCSRCSKTFATKNLRFKHTQKHRETVPSTLKRRKSFFHQILRFSLNFFFRRKARYVPHMRAVVLESRSYVSSGKIKSKRWKMREDKSRTGSDKRRKV
jgi:Zinc-finger of C2H2 type/Zinc finger, C2H2 type